MKDDGNSPGKGCFAFSVSSLSFRILFSNETRNKAFKPGLDKEYSIGSVDIIGGVEYSQLSAASVLRHGIAIG